MRCIRRAAQISRGSSPPCPTPRRAASRPTTRASFCICRPNSLEQAVPERVISADDHIDLTYLPQDLWQARLPKQFKDKGPRVEQGPTGPIWVREGKRWGFWGSKRPENQIIVYDK